MPDHSSSRTTEHWFLDLDGVRSGPYQTPEVLSLVAEGEVMPHHRISTGLKDQPWMTVLDWRLEQAKKSTLHEPEVKEVRSYIPASARPPVPPPAPEQKIEIATEEASDQNWVENPPPAAPEPEVAQAPIHAEPEPKPVQAAPVPEPEPEPAPPPPVIEHTPPHFTPEPVREVPTQTFEVRDESRPKRDPMAEMFDILQTSKQKREAKSLQQAQQSHANTILEEPAPTPASGGLSKTIGIGALITVIGFALGQIFQQSAPPPEAASSPSPSATPFVKSQIIDRSTDKITIRSRVETPQKPAAPAATPSRAAAAPRATPAAVTVASPHTEKELQELKDLKKELQELKALKEELRNNGQNYPSDEPPEQIDEFDNGNIGNAEVDPGYNYYPVAPGQSGATYPNNGYPPNYGYPQNYPGYPNNGQPSPNANVHY